jgi:hypothetical protein
MIIAPSSGGEQNPAYMSAPVFSFQAVEKYPSVALHLAFITAAYKTYASFLMTSRALHPGPSSAVALLRRMDIFEPPVRGE